MRRRAPSPSTLRAVGAAMMLATLASACTDSPTAAPAAPFARVRRPALAVVPITPSDTSTTGVPILQLPWTGGDYAMGAINESNWVVGTAASRAVLWRGGSGFELIPRPTTQAAPMRGLGLNDAGALVGEWTGSTGASLPFIWQDPTTTFLPAPPGYTSNSQAEARDIDESGNVLVYYWRQNICGGLGLFKDRSAVIAPPYSSTGYTELVTSDCNTGVFGDAIDNGSVVGHLGGGTVDGWFRWDVAAGLQVFPADFGPSDISGDYVAGRTSDGVNVVPARTAGGALELLPTLGGTYGIANGTNDAGWVVGNSYTSTAATHAFLWRPGVGIQDLGTLPDGQDYSRAVDVNEAGYIVGEAKNPNGLHVPVIWYVDPAGGTDAGMDPTIAITSPTAGEVFTAGDGITFQATASDEEDGPLSGMAVSWESSIDGALGTGTALGPITNLSAGEHTITATATDDDGNTDTDQVTVTVNEAPPPPAPPDTPDEMVQALEQGVSGLVSDGRLAADAAAGLLDKLSSIADDLAKGKMNPVQNKLGAFINEVESLSRDGEIAAADAQALIDAAQAIIASL